MYYIGIDVSKKDLLVLDGKKDLKFVNQEGLRPFKKYLKKKYKGFSDLVIIFEPTGIYSFNLKDFCAENSIKAYIVNPKKSHRFTRALGTRSKTDKIDARILHQFHRLLKKELIKAKKLEDKIFSDIKEYIKQNQNLREDYGRGKFMVTSKSSIR